MRHTLVIVLGIVLGIAGGSAIGGRVMADVVTRLPGTEAALGTPHVLDGRVHAIARVGDTLVLGGSFTRAREDGGPVLERRGLLAFNRVTGELDPRFDPAPDGIVRAVVPAGDGETVYVAGAFTDLGGVARQRVARIRVRDGTVDPDFDVGTLNGEVKALALAGGRLWIAGAFTHVDGSPQRALAAVSAETGERDRTMDLEVAGSHRDGPDGGVTQVLKVAVDGASRRLVAIGNFATVDGMPRHQLAMLDLTGGQVRVSDFDTSFYTDPCSPDFHTYLRDVDVAPDGRWFVVVTSGGYRPRQPACDSIARFETDARGPDVPPTWVNHTGGDTVTAVRVVGETIFVGGHFRWLNNPYGDNHAGPGAVDRDGLAALDPRNGLPRPWHPRRSLGLGIFDFLPTDAGLWFVSDTQRVGDAFKGRVALLAPSPDPPRAEASRPHGPPRGWRRDRARMTAHFHDEGRLYYTMRGSPLLHHRLHDPDTGLVGARRYVASGSVAGIAFVDVRAMSVAGSRLRWTTADGRRLEIGWLRDPAGGSPVPGTARACCTEGGDPG